MRKNIYVALTCDKARFITNGSYNSINAYVVQDWVRIFLLVSIEKDLMVHWMITKPLS